MKAFLIIAYILILLSGIAIILLGHTFPGMLYILADGFFIKKTWHG
jgi:hypothetical protein